MAGTENTSTMPVVKNVAIRYRIIDEMLRNPFRPYPSKEDLRSACEEKLYGSEWGEHISVSTIEKDLFNLRNDYDAPIAFNKGEGGYYYTDPAFSLERIPLNDEEKEALRFAALTLNQYAHLGVFQQFRSAIQKIFEQLSSDVDTSEEASFIYFEQLPQFNGSEWMAVFSQAIRNRRKLKVNYYSFHSREMKVFHLSPYVLKEYKGLWYVLGFADQRDKILTLELSRVQHAALLQEAAVDRPFSAKDYFRYSPGISVVAEAPEHIVLEVDRKIWPIVQRLPIHPQQAVIAQTDKWVTVAFDSYIAPNCCGKSWLTDRLSGCWIRCY